ncbi:imidazole glycerol phosphate synthase subunit HisH [Nitrococcus mobilis]|uniref:Imidazole glycerol phosphate synthase subunit HisH n=1 Tax=Nitrococcus mobilis Nb-231 TaxID=314278 RepID=A4BMG9_9GAMM|nr:imidazole glycerol phosphate synthase subunit HisH [Nitrococcus mobilis]EAR23507.1 imidazoleglycerol-phosphate synthase amidotransferase subunit-like protein [Nitrococcus mobilis Nb-231]
MTIVDFGMGNLGSIANMIKKVGGKPMVTSDPERIAAAEKLILPGVGAFDHGMRSLEALGLVSALEQAVRQHKAPILGVCLGMQLMLDASEEGAIAGLGWVSGKARRFPGDKPVLKVPHMGWNGVRAVKLNPLLELNAAERPRFYFVHSYKVECASKEDVLAVSSYGVEFCSAFQRENIFGVQFHPEKSHIFGMRLFQNFLEL